MLISMSYEIQKKYLLSAKNRRSKPESSERKSADFDMLAALDNLENRAFEVLKILKIKKFG